MKPRLACRLVRTWSALREDSHPAHLDTCPDCQAWRARASSLEHDLRRSARAIPVVPPSDLDRRILGAVAHSRAPAAASTPTRTWLPFAAFGAAAAAIAVAFVALQRPASEAALSRADAHALVATVSDLSTQFVGDVIPSAGTMIAEKNPLQHEMDAVYTDAQTALDFLALNFLPQARTASAERSIPPPRSG